MICDICKEEIAAGEKYYKMPDGYNVCWMSDCLEEWSKFYLDRVVSDDDQ